MKKLIESPLNPQKKISLNIDKTTLNLVKELAELTNTNNTLIINTLLVYGLAPLTKTFKTSWVTLLGDAKDEQRKKILNGLLNKLIKISEKKEYHHLIGG
ncbi:hypothetical protein KAJ87_00265 [Candidatus Pacearchaeota archaeon]|nr:hypothetical protein [Candidatus Pacearchaeota archaeon]